MKGYWLILGTNIIDQNAQTTYGDLWRPIAAKYQARLIVDHGSVQIRESRNTQRILMVEFPTYAIAKACYEDPDYQLAKKFALAASQRDLLIIEGEFS